MGYWVGGLGGSWGGMAPEPGPTVLERIARLESI